MRVILTSGSTRGEDVVPSGIASSPTLPRPLILGGVPSARKALTWARRYRPDPSGLNRPRKSDVARSGRAGPQPAGRRGDRPNTFNNLW